MSERGGVPPTAGDERIGEIGAPREAEPFELHPGDRASIERELPHYEDPRAATIEALRIVQARHGWVPDGAIRAVADVLGVPATDVEGVATFHNLIFRRPVGRHVIQVCDSVACFLTGSDAITETLRRQLRIAPGETTKDGRFTLLPICCLGACDKGPVLMIDADTHGSVSAESVAQLLERYP